MKYFKDTNNIVHAFAADGSEDEYVAKNRPDLIAISDVEADALRAPPVEAQADALARAICDIRKKRAPMLDALAGIGYDAWRAGDDVTAQAVDAARAGLRDITKLPDFLAAATYEQMELVVMARYKELANAAPAIVKGAFVETVAP